MTLFHLLFNLPQKIIHLDENHKKETGNLLIYLHYFILFGLSLVTVSLKFIGDDEANHLFAVSCLYLGILLIYIGIKFATYYNKTIDNKNYYLNIACFFTTMIIAYIICFRYPTLLTITLTTAIFSLINTALMVKLTYQTSDEED